MVIVFLLCAAYAVDFISAAYFDGELKAEGLKLAGLTGAEFETSPKSPYYNEDPNIKTLPHEVKLRNFAKKEKNGRGWFGFGKKKEK